MAVLVTLREPEDGDMPILFEQQRDPQARFMAAFTSAYPEDRAAFAAWWQRILDNENIYKRIILADGVVAGNILSFEAFGEREVGYWLGREFWGQGIATAALEQFLTVVTFRPLGARAAKDNAGSIRVLQKCGFKIVGEDKGYAEARRSQTEEFVFRLE